jgi:FkbM family methyltransferase
LKYVFLILSKITKSWWSQVTLSTSGHFRKIVIGIISSFKPKSSVTLSNLLFFRKIGKVSLVINEGKIVFLLEQKRKKFYFYSLKRGIKYYRLGLEHRAIEIASSYGIDNISFNKGDVVIDCGANTGDLHLYVSGFDCEYIAFEPDPVVFKALNLNVPEYSYNIALSDKAGDLDFFLSSDNADSSLVQPSYFTSKQLVKVKRLDDIIQRKDIKLLKIEAEGHELEVLFGASNILNIIEFIAVDGSCEKGVEKESTLEGVINYLIPLGFDIVWVDLVGKGRGWGRALFHRKINTNER